MLILLPFFFFFLSDFSPFLSLSSDFSLFLSDFSLSLPLGQFIFSSFFCSVHVSGHLKNCPLSSVHHHSSLDLSLPLSSFYLFSIFSLSLWGEKGWKDGKRKNRRKERRENRKNVILAVSLHQIEASFLLG